LANCSPDVRCIAFEKKLKGINQGVEMIDEQSCFLRVHVYIHRKGVIEMLEEAVATSNQINFIDHTATVKNRRGYWIVKRTQDIVLSSIALIVLLPIMLLVALIIYIDDPHGSPIFTQVRCGRKGKTFKMYKFRSMYTDAEKRLEELLKYNEMDGPAFKIKHDPRITRVGKFIRATSIDELPQLWNVLTGSMSIVGEGCIIGTTRKTLDLARVLTA
jgi:lipopolysaccharide/colanic/teichoic acid biosynthesis glycosyltransferase